MRIVGGKDYYDHGLAYGVDQSVVFVRTGQRMHEYRYPGVFPWTWGAAPRVALPDNGGARLHNTSWREVNGSTRWWHEGTSYMLQGVMVIFCGRYYGGAQLLSYKPVASRDRYDYEQWRDPGENKWQRETFWDQNTLGRRLAKCGARVDTAAGRYTGARSAESKPFYRAALPPGMLAQQIELGVAVATKDPSDTERVKRKGYSHEIEEGFWRVNEDTLKRYDFVKVIDPVQAFQQLAMWVGGVLPRSGNPMVEITDDKVKAHKAGFDQWSFRKMPEKTK